MRKLQIDEVKPTRNCLQLADCSIKFLSGVVEDLLVKVGSFIFPADFMILDMEEDKNASIILGRSFLATGRCMRIDIIEPLIEEVLEAGKLEDDLDASPEDTLLEVDEW
nr:uncharacterized protein LOC112742838 [Arachis hypogaea]